MKSTILITSKTKNLVTHYSLNHLTSNEDFTSFKPQNPQYKKLKNGEFTSLTLRIMDQNNDIITDGPQVTEVLHIHDSGKL